MLVLSRKTSEVIVVEGSDAQQSGIRIVVMEIRNGSVRLGVEAPASVPVHRTEVWKRIQTDRPVANAS